MDEIKKTSSGGKSTKLVEKQENEINHPDIQLLQAILNVMSEVEYLQKDDTVGTGASSYKGISDEKVKFSLRNSMMKNGLFCLPLAIEKETRVDRWEEMDAYKKDVVKTKQQIFSDIVFTFRIYHISGAYIDGQSSGHGVDSQDKAVGKSMTYAMKYFLLNLFMIPTGLDSDKIHSDSYDIAPTEEKKKVETKVVTPPVVLPSKPKYPTIDEIDNLLYEKTGILADNFVDGVVNNWKKNGAALLYGKYIYTVTGNKFNYFKLDEHQVNRIAKDIKFKHG